MRVAGGFNPRYYFLMKQHPRPTGLQKLLVCGVLAGAIAVVYANALDNDFVFDDYLLVVERPQLRSDQSLWHFFLSPFSFGYRPFRTFSYLLDVRMGGMRPRMFHVSNLVYHWVCSCLVFLIALRLTTPSAVDRAQVYQDEAIAKAEWHWRPALFVVGLWSLHPVLTDAVTYISGRRDILGGLGVFCGFWFYLRFRAAVDQGLKKYGWLLLACLVYGLGIMSKESAVVLPLLCWLYDVQQEGWIASLRRRWAAYFLILLIGVAVLWHFSGDMILATYRHSTWYGGSLQGNFATVVRIWVHDLGLMIFPRTLLADYSYNAFPASSSFAEPEVVYALAVLLSVVGGLVLLARRFPLCGFAGWWMLVNILPFSHIIPIKEILAEHYLYVPLFGWCLIVGVILDALCGTVAELSTPGRWMRPAVVYGLFCCVLVAAGARIVVRNRDWVNEETFWFGVIQRAPQSVRGHYNLAGVYKRQQRAADAEREFSATLAIAPQHADALVGLGEIAFETGRYQLAFDYATQAYVIAPQNPRVVYLLGWMNLVFKDFDGAERLFQQADRLMPNSRDVYTGLEEVAKGRGDKEAALHWAAKRRHLETKERE